MNDLSSRTPRHTTAIALAIALFGVCALALRSGAEMRLFAPSTPPLVGIVDLERLLSGDGLDELRVRNKNLEAKFKAEMDEANKIRSQGQELVKQLEQVPKENMDQRRKLARQVKELDGRLEALEQYLGSALSAEKANTIRDLYAKVNAAIAQYAAQHNIDLVLMDDQAMDVPTEPNDRLVNEAIIRRRILFANKAKLDITTDVLTLLNNQFAAGGAKPAPPKAAEKKGTPKK